MERHFDQVGSRTFCDSDTNKYWRKK